MTQTPLRVPSDVAELGASIPYPDLIPEEYFRNSLDLNRFSNKVGRICNGADGESIARRDSVINQDC